jgi:flagellar hook-associated protein 2
MAGIASFSGLGSGIDFSKLTEAILAERSRPLSQLQSRSSQLSKRNDAYKQLNTKLATLTEAANALTNQELGNGRLASTTASDKITASASASAATGTFNLAVTRIASSLTQASRAYASTSTAVLAGGATTATFELRLGGASEGTEITIDSSNNTLAGLRDAINAADAGVTATIVATDVAGTQNKLVLTSNATGTAGRVELVETTATGTLTDLNIVSLNPPGATNDFSDLDAVFTVNGLSLTRSSNTVSDAVSGVTFNLLDSGSATVTVASSRTDFEARLRSFVNAYNGVQEAISGQYATGSKGQPTGILAGDSTLRAVQTQLRNALNLSSTNNGGSFDNLTQLGIGRSEDGKLTLDETTLSSALTNSFSDARALLSGLSDTDTGLANSFYDSFKTLSDSVTGLVKNAITGNESSIKTIEKTVSDQLARLSSLRQSLTRQFAAVDAAINQLNGQGTALTNLFEAQKQSTKSK